MAERRAVPLIVAAVEAVPLVQAVQEATGRHQLVLVKAGLEEQVVTVLAVLAVLAVSTVVPELSLMPRMDQAAVAVAERTMERLAA